MRAALQSNEIQVAERVSTKSSQFLFWVRPVAAVLIFFVAISVSGRHAFPVHKRCRSQKESAVEFAFGLFLLPSN